MQRRNFLITGALTACAPGFVLGQLTVTKIIVPFAPGAGSDAMARFIAAELTKSTGRQFIVENRAGAGGAIGADFVAKAPPDGQTLLFIASPFTTVAAAGQLPRYEPSEFAPVAIMGSGPLLFAAHPAVAANDLKEFIALARNASSQLNYGSAGNGSINHLMVELLKQQTGAQITHVPYKGIAPATQDAVAGQLQLVTGSIPALMPLIKEGRLKALAVSSRRRSPVVDQIPCMEELGFKLFDVNNYWGLMAPPKTPANLIEPLNAEVNRLLREPSVVARLRQDATEPSPMATEAIRSYLGQDVQRWRSLIAQANLKLD